jgi:hypothetical protein
VIRCFGANAGGTSFLQNGIEVVAAGSSEIFVSIYKTTHHYILQDSNLVIEARLGGGNGKEKDSHDLYVVSTIIVLF